MNFRQLLSTQTVMAGLTAFGSIAVPHSASALKLTQSPGPDNPAQIGIEVYLNYDCVKGEATPGQLAGAAYGTVAMDGKRSTDFQEGQLRIGSSQIKDFKGFEDLKPELRAAYENAINKTIAQYIAETKAACERSGPQDFDKYSRPESAAKPAFPSQSPFGPGYIHADSYKP